MNARHHRRLVILKLRIVRQILGEMPDQPCDGGNSHEEHHGSGGKQETQEPHQQAHMYFRPVLAPKWPTPFKVSSAMSRLSIRRPAALYAAARQFRSIP